MRLSRRVQEIEDSPTLAISAEAKRLKKAGEDVVLFGAGEPDFQTPRPVVDAAVRAMEEGFTRYTPAAGTPELKEAVCRWLAEETGVEYTPSQVVISCGAKHSLYNVMQALLEEGDEVLLPMPYWVSYPEQIKLAGAKPIPVDVTGNDFKVNRELLDAHLTPAVRMLILNSPSNPTGAVYNREELAEVADFCVEHGIVVVSDEIYSRLVYDGAEHVSIASLGDRIRELSVMINGVSKTYAMTGWRIGFMAGDEELAAAVGRLQSQSTSNPTSISQAAALEALTMDQGVVEEMRATFDRRRRLMADMLNEIPGIECSLPQGAFYCFARVNGLFGKRYDGEVVDSASDFARLCLEKCRVALVPGEGFGTPDYVRLSYAVSEDRIEEGLKRVKELVERMS